jgi:hypothetical protein
VKLIMVFSIAALGIADPLLDSIDMMSDTSSMATSAGMSGLSRMSYSTMSR